MHVTKTTHLLIPSSPLHVDLLPSVFPSGNPCDPGGFLRSLNIRKPRKTRGFRLRGTSSHGGSRWFESSAAHGLTAIHGPNRQETNPETPKITLYAQLSEESIPRRPFVAAGGWILND